MVRKVTLRQMGGLVAVGLFVAISLYATGCAVQQRATVPEMAPDFTPTDLYHDSVMVADAQGSRWSRAVIAIHFSADATQSERQRVINAIDGIVAGGVVLIRDGYYLVRVPHDTTLAGVDRAISRVTRFASVESAIRIAAPIEVPRIR